MVDRISEVANMRVVRQLGKIEGRLDAADEARDRLNGSFDKLAAKIESMEERVRRTEYRLYAAAGAVTALQWVLSYLK